MSLTSQHSCLSLDVSRITSPAASGRAFADRCKIMGATRTTQISRHPRMLGVERQVARISASMRGTTALSTHEASSAATSQECRFVISPRLHIAKVVSSCQHGDPGATRQWRDRFAATSTSARSLPDERWARQRDRRCESSVTPRPASAVRALRKQSSRCGPCVLRPAFGEIRAGARRRCTDGLSPTRP